MLTRAQKQTNTSTAQTNLGLLGLLVLLSLAGLLENLGGQEGVGGEGGDSLREHSEKECLNEGECGSLVLLLEEVKHHLGLLVGRVLNGRVGAEDEVGEVALPQSADATLAEDLHEGSNPGQLASVVVLQSGGNNFGRSCDGCGSASGEESNNKVDLRGQSDLGSTKRLLHEGVDVEVDGVPSDLLANFRANTAVDDREATLFPQLLESSTNGETPLLNHAVAATLDGVNRGA